MNPVPALIELPPEEPAVAPHAHVHSHDYRAEAAEIVIEKLALVTAAMLIVGGFVAVLTAAGSAHVGARTLAIVAVAVVLAGVPWLGLKPLVARVAKTRAERDPCLEEQAGGGSCPCC